MGILARSPPPRYRDRKRRFHQVNEKEVRVWKRNGRNDMVVPVKLCRSSACRRQDEIPANKLRDITVRPAVARVLLSVPLIRDHLGQAS